jgi:hypothetical protein
VDGNFHWQGKQTGGRYAWMLGVLVKWVIGEQRAGTSTCQAIKLGPSQTGQ